MTQKWIGALLAAVMLLCTLGAHCIAFADDNSITDNTALLAVLEQIESFDEEDYTPSSFSALSALYDQYRPIAQTMQNQEEIDSAVRDLLEAMNNLIAYLNLAVSANTPDAVVSVTVNQTAGGAGNYTALYGDTVTLTAAEADGYFFAGWMETVSKRILSDSSEYTFTLSVNTSLQALYFRYDTSVLLFITEGNWVVSFTEKTPQEWAQVTDLTPYIPAVPYHYGYTNGRWDLPADALSRLADGEYVEIYPLYDEADTTLPAITQTPDDDILLELHYRLDAENHVGSFIMNASLPEDTNAMTVQSVGMLFYYKRAAAFDPTAFCVNINNKMMVSQYDTLHDPVYITNMKKLTARYNWAARGYATYADENGTLHTVYSNQVNIINSTDLHEIRQFPPVEATCTADGRTGGSYCFICGEMYEEPTVVPALGHQMTSVVTQPTCTENGCITYSCTRCQYHDTEQPQWDDASGTYTHPELLALGHDYQFSQVTVAATLDDIGECEETCSRCGDSVTQPYYIAQGSCGDNTSYTFDHRTHTLTISGSGAMADYESPGNSPFCNNSNIESVVMESGVTSIGSCAFYGCSNLTQLSIADTVTAINSRAFYQCEQLDNVTIPGSVQNIGYYAFYGCTGMQSLTLSEGLVTIGNYAFSTCSSLTGLTIPSTVTAIGKYAFTKCTSLGQISIPATVTNLDTDVFSYCTGLTAATVAQGTQQLAARTFYGCTALTGVYLPPGLQSIGERAFFNCSSLSNLTLPDHLIVIDSYAFYHCSSLGNITLPNTVTIIGESAFEGCTGMNTSIPANVSTLEPKAFKDCTSLTTVAIPQGITELASGVFQHCTALQQVTFHNLLTQIGAYAFYECSSLTSVAIPDSVTSIGNSAFYGGGLTSLSVGENVSSIGNYAFADCTGLLSITVDADNTVYDSRNGCNAVIATATDTLLFGCRNTIIPDTVTAIESRAFENCEALHSLNIPSSVTSIGTYAFRHTGLTQITLPSGITTVADYSFADCGSLTGITLPDSVTVIRQCAFLNCTSITGVVLPLNLNTIGTSAFSGCTSLTAMDIPSGVTSVSSRAFMNCTGITSLTINSGIKTIGIATFDGCSGIMSVSLPNTVTTISSNAFRGCSAITDIYIYNIGCKITSSATTLPVQAAIHSYLSSTAKTYADNFSRTFIQIT